MRALLVTTSVLMLASCAPGAPAPVNCQCIVLDRASDLTGDFDVRVLEVRTLEGPATLAPDPAVSLPLHLARTESAITGELAGAAWLSPVAANVTLVPWAGGCCPGPWGVAATQPADWRETDGVRVDTLTELGGALEAFDASVTVDGPAGALGDLPVRTIDATGMTLTSTYTVRGPGCANAQCASQVAVTYRFERRAF